MVSFLTDLKHFVPEKKNDDKENSSFTGTTLGLGNPDCRHMDGWVGAAQSRSKHIYNVSTSSTRAHAPFLDDAFPSDYRLPQMTIHHTTAGAGALQVDKLEALHLLDDGLRGAHVAQ